MLRREEDGSMFSLQKRLFLRPGEHVYTQHKNPNGRKTRGRPLQHSYYPYRLVRDKCHERSVTKLDSVDHQKTCGHRWTVHHCVGAKRAQHREADSMLLFRTTSSCLELASADPIRSAWLDWSTSTTTSCTLGSFRIHVSIPASKTSAHTEVL
nr:hypothetical protein CFP56_31605 [Quercus suber]